MARLKATSGNVIDTTGVKFNRVMQLSQKTGLLTEPEIAILEHFVHSNAAVLNNTVYMGNDIVYPVSSSSTSYYRQAHTGKIIERAAGTGPLRPVKAPAATEGTKKRGRPPFAPPKHRVFTED